MSAKLHIRLFSFVLAFVMAVSILPAGIFSVRGAGNNALYNGDFNIANVSTQTVSGWSLNPSNPNHKVTVQNTVSYSGNALKIEATGTSYFYAQDFVVESGATYILSYQIRVDAADGLRYAPFLNDSNYKGGWWKDYATDPVCGVTDGWTEVYNVITVPKSVGENPANSQSKIQIGFKVYSGSAVLYLDNVSFAKTDIHLDDPNLDFENALTTNSAPSNWQPASGQGLQVSSDTSVYHSGSQSIHVSKDSLLESSYLNSQVHIPVVEEDIYEFSFWMCSRNASPTATIRMELLAYSEDGTLLENNYLVYGSVASLNNGTERSEWTKVVTRAAVPAGTAYACMRFRVTRGTAELWLDDIFFEVVEDGVDCVVYYDDFHAVDESGNISTWKMQGNGAFSSENGGKLKVTDEAYIYNEMTCLMTGYTYCIKGEYTADVGGSVQLRFYDQFRQEYTGSRVTVPLQAGSNTFGLTVTAPSHTYAALYIGAETTGTVTVKDVTAYMLLQPQVARPNNSDPAWTEKADRDNVVSSVELYNGAPTLMIDGEPTASYFYLRPDLDDYLHTDAETRIHKSGLDLYITYGGSLYKGGCDPIWLSDGSIDYAAFDAVIYETLAANDDALVMVNIGMFAPKWWLEQNPDHQAMAHNGSSYIPLGDVSLASEKFRQEAGEVLRSLIRHMKTQNYYNRVFGLKISGGQSYEWFCWGTEVDQGPDYSAASQEGFRDYLQRKYGTDAALQAAWGNSSVTIATAAAPGWDQRCESSNVYMGSADTGEISRNMVDWNLWLNEASADSFLYYCQIAKEETENQIIVGGYNGYLWTNNSYDAQGMAHTAMDRVLDSEYVDWIASPISYNERLLGQSDTFMALIDSVQEHGKIYIAEQDNRTCLSDSYAGTSWDAGWDFQVGQTRTMADTLYQQRRDFANALTNGVGLWQFDMYGGWLDDDQLYEHFRNAKAEYDLSVYLDRQQRNEVAVFVGDETYAYLTAENSNMSFTLLEPMLLQQRKHLAVMGAGYDTYALSSLLEGKVAPHKLNIVLSPFEITEEMHTAIDTYLKTNGRVVVWVYLPGISDGTKLDVANVARTTGFSVGVVEEKSTLQVQITDSAHSLTEGIAGLVYGNSTPKSVSPRAYIQNTDGVNVLGYELDGGKAGLAIRDMGSWTSVYSAAPCLDVALLRNLLKLAGCHIYSESNADVIYSSNHYVALHSAAAGQKRICLPGSYSVYDVFEDRFVSMNTNTITFEHDANDTHLFRLLSSDTYAVTARVESGKGTLSAPGLTEVSPGDSYNLTVTPQSGYSVSSVKVNGKTVQLRDGGILQLDGVWENTDIRVCFAKQLWPENGDFEKGSFGGELTAQGAQIVSDSRIYSGSYSLHLNRAGADRDFVELTVYPEPSERDRQIVVRFWAKTAEGAVRYLHRGAHFFTADWKRTQNSVYDAVYPSRTQWQQYTQEFTLPAGTDIFQYQLYTDAENASVYIDDISILCEGYPLAVNGGLERGNLTGSFSKYENTPQIVKSDKVHSGSYAVLMPQNASVTAQVNALNVGKESGLELSCWLRAETATTVAYTVSYDTAAGQRTTLEGKWDVSADSTWNERKIEFPVSADMTNVTAEIKTVTGKCSLDDISLSPKAVAQMDPQDAYIKAWNVTLAGDLRVNFLAYIPEDQVPDTQVTLTMADQTCTYAASKAEYDANEQAYVFRIHAAASQMNTPIRIQITNGKQSLLSEQYTIAKYARTVLSDDTFNACHSLVRQMLHYGAAAQVYFDYGTDELANAGIVPGNSMEIPDRAPTDMTVTGKADGITLYGASLMFRSILSVRYYFKITGNVDDYNFAVDGRTCEAVEDDGLYYVETLGISPDAWNYLPVLTATDASGNTLTVSYSPMNFMVRMKAKGSGELKALLKAMYNYHLEAQNYVTKKDISQ